MTRTNPRVTHYDYINRQTSGGSKIDELLDEEDTDGTIILLDEDGNDIEGEDF